MHPRRLVLLSLLPLLSVSWSGQADPIQLPDMGASSASTLSPQREKEIGREVLRQLRRSGSLVEDPFINAYVERLGYRLLSVTDTDTEFTFFVLNDPTINAFALPGGYIGINAGLIMASRSESEVAGVVAHEIAHVTQSHIARSLEESNRMNLPFTAALIAAVILGRQDPQMGQAAIASALAGSTQSRLDFTRSHEQEADRVGLALLAQSGFDPEGMPSFFERLYQETRFSGGEAAQLEFLRTHPVTVSRIADSRNRANQYAHQSFPTPIVDYEYAKALLHTHTARDPSSATRHFEEALSHQGYQNPSAAYLGLALALIDQGRGQAALEAVSKAEANRAPHALIMRIRAQAERALGSHEKAEITLRKGTALFPEDSGLVLAYGRLLLDQKRPAEAAALAYAYLRRRPTASAYALVAEAETARSRQAAAHMALAEQYYLMDEVNLAIDQLRLARQDPKADFYTLSRIDARLEELKQARASIDEKKQSME